MKKILEIFSVLIILSVSCVISYSSSEKKIDDWQYNATIEIEEGRSLPASLSRLKGGSIRMQMAPSSQTFSKTLGLSVGGARDANNFYENIKHGYLPKIHSITYEGVFAEHYFDIETKEQCNELFCPNFFTAVIKNPYTQEVEYYINAGLASGIKEKDFKRKKLNLVIVLDISGSMSSPFNAYYYDRGKKVKAPKEDLNKSKMQIANESIVAMFNHLTDDDRLGIVLFDDRAYLAKPLRLVKYTDMEAIKRHVLELQPRGGTNWSAGYKKGLSLFEKLEQALRNQDEYENRIIFLTDAMPNRGELSEHGLFGLFKKASNKGIYTTFIGIGVDFNNDLVHLVSRTKGANYFSVHSSTAFKKRMDKEFDYWVTPLVFDLKMELISNNFSIDAIYGAPEADKKNGTLFYLGTLFPSDTKDERVKGGIILVKLKKGPDSTTNAFLRLSYKDRSGKIHKIKKKVSFSKCCYYENSAIRKGILLAQYVSLMQNWLIDARKECNDYVSSPQPVPPIRKKPYPPEPPHILKQKALSYPPDRPEWVYIKSWERRSCPLKVSPGYKKLFSFFFNYFKNEISALNGSDLKKELDTVKFLADLKKNNDKEKIDDWQIKN